MTLGELSIELKRIRESNPGLALKQGFADPHSFRGYYNELAFEIQKDQHIDQAIEVAESAVGKVFTGWKGGDFPMDEETDVWWAQEGTSWNATKITFDVLYLLTHASGGDIDKGEEYV